MKSNEKRRPNYKHPPKKYNNNSGIFLDSDDHNDQYYDTGHVFIAMTEKIIKMWSLGLAK